LETSQVEKDNKTLKSTPERVFLTVVDEEGQIGVGFSLKKLFLYDNYKN